MGKNIKRARQEQHLSQYRLAEACNLSLSYICGIERGNKNPTINTILSLCEALELKPYQLFFNPAGHTASDQPETNLSLIVNLIQDAKNTIAQISKITFDYFNR